MSIIRALKSLNCQIHELLLAFPQPIISDYTSHLLCHDLSEKHFNSLTYLLAKA